eukprot:3922458-Karenia_brevis.AAC.1
MAMDSAHRAVGGQTGDGWPDQSSPWILGLGSSGCCTIVWMCALWHVNLQRASMKSAPLMSS